VGRLGSGSRRREGARRCTRPGKEVHREGRKTSRCSRAASRTRKAGCPSTSRRRRRCHRRARQRRCRRRQPVGGTGGFRGHWSSNNLSIQAHSNTTGRDLFYISHVVQHGHREGSLVASLTSSGETEDIGLGGAVRCRDLVVVSRTGLEATELHVVEVLAALGDRGNGGARRGAVVAMICIS